MQINIIDEYVVVFVTLSIYVAKLLSIFNHKAGPVEVYVIKLLWIGVRGIRPVGIFGKYTLNTGICPLI